MKKYFILCALFSFVLSGCAFNDMRAEFFGMRPLDVEKAQNKIVTIYDIPVKDCLAKIEQAVKDIGGQVDSVDKKTNFIIAYSFVKRFTASIDTTEVGILVKDAGGSKSEVMVFSLNSALARFVAGELFTKLKQ